MANTYYSIAANTSLVDIASALQDKFGAAITIYYQNASNLIFYCTALSTKVIKLTQLNSNYSLEACFGDAWTSGSTITNSVVFAQSYTGGPTMHLILGENLFLFVTYSSINGSTNQALVVGKLSNDACVCVGLNYASSTYGRAKDVTNNVDITLQGLSKSFISADGKLYKQPIVFIDSSGTVKQNTDGTFAYLDGLYSVSFISGKIPIKGATYFISPSNYKLVDGSELSTSLLVEL